MTTGTIIMIVCAVLLVLLKIFFKEDLENMDKNCTPDDDPCTQGADGISGISGEFSENLGVFKKHR